MAKSCEPTAASERGNAGKEREHWRLRLYVAGQSPKSLEAFANLSRICEEHLEEHYDLEVVDLQENPQLAAEDQILAIPTLIRKLPPPVKKLIGTMSDTERVLICLDVRKVGSKSKGRAGPGKPHE